MAPPLTSPSIPVTARQIDAVDQLAATLRPDQVLWLSGYLAALADRQTPAATTHPAPDPQATVLFGTQTGNSRRLAEKLTGRLEEHAGQLRSLSMADYRINELSREKQLLIIVSTHGEGDPPDSAQPFFKRLLSDRAPRLEGLGYAVLALGDSSYEHYCKAGRDIDARLQELGGTRLQALVECDVDFQEPSEAWIDEVVPRLAFETASNVVAMPTTGRPPANRHTRDRPADGTILENQPITGAGSESATFHLEIAVDSGDFNYAPGDALGVWHRNPEVLVDGLLTIAGLDGSEPVDVDGERKELIGALRADRELTQITPRNFARYAELTGRADAAEHINGLAPRERARLLRNWHLEDILRHFPADLDAQALVDSAGPLQPRLYSIASSPETAPGEIHLTVARIGYAHEGRVRSGAASGYLEGLVAGDALSVYLEPNRGFHLPNSDVPIIMIGAGTGIAPFRAFVEHRAAAGMGAPSWLFFGHRHFRTDFLYQAEWLNHLKSGRLTRMAVTFSRDRSEKRYVQHLVAEHAQEFTKWLDEGAHIYVCGSIAMGQGVNQALQELLGGADGEGRLTELQEGGKLHRDVY